MASCCEKREKTGGRCLEKAMSKLQVVINRVKKRADRGNPTHGEMMDWAGRLETVMGMMVESKNQDD